MSEILCIQHWPKRSAIPADEINLQWVFHYGAGDPDNTAFDKIRDLLDAFWNTNPTGSAFSPASRMGRSLAAGSGICTLEMFDITDFLDGSPHGSPVALRALDIPGVASSDAGLPAEVCSVLTYHRPYVGDVEFGAGGLRPRARDRGRLYIGPLAQSGEVLDATTQEVYVAQDVRECFVNAGKDLIAEVDTVRWAQWSRADASVGIVSGCWMDNAWDIQRRRGVKATVRTTYDV